MSDALQGQTTVAAGEATRLVDEFGAVLGGAAKAAKVAGAQLPASTTAAIANGASLSGAIDLGETRLSRIAVPSAGWTAAAITFETSYDGVTYLPLYDDTGAEVTVQAAAGRTISLHNLYALFQDVRWLKIRSGTNAAPVTQGGARALNLAVRSL